MNYIEIAEFGGPEVLKLEQGESPTAKAGEVLIKVIAAGVNRPDVVQRQGHYPAPSGASPILGLEVSGEVVALGEGVSQWAIGDRVCALANGGGYAEWVAVPARQCLPIPDGLTMIEAAALPETCFTVWSNVFDRCGLKAGDNFLVHGGASGIGTTAIQIASALGAKVYTTVGSVEKADVCKALGAKLAINYHDADFAEVLKDVVGKRGIDVTLDIVGGNYINRNIKVAAMDGRIVNIGFLQGAVAEVNFMLMMLKRLTLTGSTLRPQSDEVKAGIAESLEKMVWPLISAGKVKPVIARTFPLIEACEAHKLMESNQHIGKIVLTIAE